MCHCSTFRLCATDWQTNQVSFHSVVRIFISHQVTSQEVLCWPIFSLIFIFLYFKFMSCFNLFPTLDLLFILLPTSLWREQKLEERLLFKVFSFSVQFLWKFFLLWDWGRVRKHVYTLRKNVVRVEWGWFNDYDGLLAIWWVL